MKKFIALLLFTLTTSAYGGEKEIRKLMESSFPNMGKLEHVAKTPYLGLYEITVNGQLYYVDEKAKYLFEIITFHITSPVTFRA